jgi:SAM-dependent methyltransferase
MLRLAAVKPRDRVIDLGSGDGRIVITAARRFGASGLGVEIDPQLVERSRVNARAAGVERRAEFREQDLFKTDLAPFSVVTMYLLPEVNMQLRPTLAALRPGTRIVSHDWDLGDWRPDRTLTVAAPDKAIGREKLSRLHLWIVPARFEGLWCGVGARGRGLSLALVQQHQVLSARADDSHQHGRPGVGHDAERHVLNGQADGAKARLLGANGTSMSLRFVDAATIEVSVDAAATPRWRGARLARSAGATCAG